jgi:site-specific recombinase XerD
MQGGDMNAITTNRNQDVDLSKAVLKSAMDRAELITNLQTALDVLYPAEERYASAADGSPHKMSRIRYNDSSDAIKLFADFLTKAGRASSNIDEALMDEFEQFVAIQKAHWGKKSRAVVGLRVRTVINGLTDSLRNRVLLSPREQRKATRFDDFTPETKAALSQFLADGRRVKKNGDGKPLLTDRLLSASYRNGAVECLRLFLKTLGKNDVLSISAADSEKFIEIYTARDDRRNAVSFLVDMQPFFLNLWARGLIGRLPFITTYIKRNCVNDDFVPPEQLAILQDISTVDMKDIVAVRNRLLTFCLCYDFALRIGEVARLKVSDVAINEYVELTIRSEIQKGNGKPERLAYSYFPESKTLMATYLKLRERMSPSTDALMITEKGKPLLGDGCRNALQELCRELGVTTSKGEVPAPHRFRHSFGTCNIKPLGLKLDVYDIMRRLRHTSSEVTTKNYINENPLLNKTRHDVQVKAARLAAQQTNSGGSHQSMNLPFADNPAANDCSVGENHALAQVAPLGIVRTSLQKYAQAKGLVEKRNDGWFYSRRFIEGLPQNYFSKQEAMRIIGIKKSAFFYWVASKGIEQVVIGKVSLVRKDDVMAKSRAVV